MARVLVLVCTSHSAVWRYKINTGEPVMRADGVLRLLLNASLFHGMSCAIGQDPKFIKISTLESDGFVHHAIKVRPPYINELQVLFLIVF